MYKNKTAGSNRPLVSKPQISTYEQPTKINSYTRYQRIVIVFFLFTKDAVFFDKKYYRFK